MAEMTSLKKGPKSVKIEGYIIWPIVGTWGRRELDKNAR